MHAKITCFTVISQ